MIAAEHFPQSHYLHRSKKPEVQKNTVTNLLGLLQLNELSILELSLSVSLSVALDISENHRYKLCLCASANSFEKELFFERCDVTEYT